MRSSVLNRAALRAGWQAVVAGCFLTACGSSGTAPYSFLDSVDASRDSGAESAPLVLTGGEGGAASCVRASDCEARGTCVTASCVGAGGQETTAGYCVYSPTDAESCMDASTPGPDASLPGDATTAPADAGAIDAPSTVIESGVPDAFVFSPCDQPDASNLASGSTVLASGWLPSVPTDSGLFAHDFTGASDMWRFDGTAWTPLCATLDDVLGNVSVVNGQLLALSPALGQILDSASSASTFDGSSWTPLGPGPTAYSQGLLAPQNGGLVFLSPQEMANGAVVPSVTWTWLGGSWTASTASPPTNFQTYFGTPTVAGKAVALSADATWVWSGTAWTKLTIPGPPARSDFAVAPLGDRLVLFGGIAPGITFFSDTWSFDGSAWTELNIAGPSARDAPAMAPLGDKIVLYGGVSESKTLADTWLFDGTAWTELAIPGPPARYGALMATP